MLPNRLNAEELEKAYAVVAELEKQLVDASRDQRLLFFTEVSLEMSDRNIPTFNKGTTMSQAFRMGMDAGVESVFNACDRRDVVLMRDETYINVDLGTDGPDLISMADLWASHINS